MYGVCSKYFLQLIGLGCCFFSCNSKLGRSCSCSGKAAQSIGRGKGSKKCSCSGLRAPWNAINNQAGRARESAKSPGGLLDACATQCATDCGTLRYIALHYVSGSKLNFYQHPKKVAKFLCGAWRRCGGRT